MTSLKKVTVDIKEAHKGGDKKIICQGQKNIGILSTKVIEPVKEANGAIITEKRKTMELLKQHFR